MRVRVNMRVTVAMRVGVTVRARSNMRVTVTMWARVFASYWFPRCTLLIIHWSAHDAVPFTALYAHIIAATSARSTAALNGR